MMIVELFLNIIFNLVNLILTPVSWVLQPLGSMAGLVELLSYASLFIPMPTFAICVSIWIGFYGLRFVVTIANWLIAKIPTIE